MLLSRDEWTRRRLSHEERVDAVVHDHVGRRGIGVKHPVEDFLFRKVKITSNLAAPGKRRKI